MSQQATEPRQDRDEVEGRPLSSWITVAIVIAVVTLGLLDRDRVERWAQEQQHANR